MNSFAAMEALYNIVERAIPINVGDDQRGVGFMKIALIGHCKVHLRKGEYLDGVK